MAEQPSHHPPEVFVSYASRDREPVVRIVGQLEAAGVTVWRDQEMILGGGNYGPEIVAAIKNSKVLMLMCSDASMRSRNVKQEIQLAWSFERPYLPLLLDQCITTSYPDQVKYWLEGCQWIPVLDLPPSSWLPQVLQALRRAGVVCGGGGPDRPATGQVAPVRPDGGLKSLRRLACFTDQIWTVPADAMTRGVTRGPTRGLGAPQPEVEHKHRLGSRVRLVIECEKSTHLLLLDEGPEGILYCLCPSRFAPETRLPAGRSVLPQAASEYDAFIVTGLPGREHLLAILTDDPPGLDWTPASRDVPARVLSDKDVKELLGRLGGLAPNQWTVLATYFDVVA